MLENKYRTKEKIRKSSFYLLHSTGNSAQCYVAARVGGEFGGEWIHVYVWLSPFAVHLKLSHCLSAILQYKIKSLKKEIENHPFIDIN